MRFFLDRPRLDHFLKCLLEFFAAFVRANSLCGTFEANGEESGRWTKEDGDPEPVELASLSAPGDMEEITIHGRRNGNGILSDDDIVGIIYNETASLHGPDLHKARIDLASSIMNADEAWGPKRKDLAGTKPTTIPQDPPVDKKVLADVQEAVAEARRIRDAGGDPTDFSTNFNIPYTVMQPGNPAPDEYTLQKSYPKFFNAVPKEARGISIWHNPIANRYRPK